MFTGIVEELGELVEVRHGTDSAVLSVRGPIVSGDATLGSSIAVNGVCLTVIAIAGERLSFDVMGQTLALTSLGALRAGDRVNLERAMPVTGRFGGHLVQGHVDATAPILGRTPGENWEVVRIGLPADLVRYVAERGSITVDGVSLTVSALVADSATGPAFEVSLIPTTLAVTTLGVRSVGDLVNLEVDVIARHLEALLAGRELEVR